MTNAADHRLEKHSVVIAGHRTSITLEATFWRALKAIAKARDFEPDLLLLDYMMPEMNGMQTLQALRQIPELATTPAIFMTAKAMESIEGEMTGMGVLGRITKPFDPVTLPNEIRRYWSMR